MIKRTLKFYGVGYGTTSATMTATLDGSIVFIGEVPTVNQTAPEDPAAANVKSVELFAIEIPVDFGGQKAMTCEVTNGTIFFAQILANHGHTVINPVFTDHEWEILNQQGTTKQQKVDIFIRHAHPSFSQEELNLLLGYEISPKERRDIQLAHGVAKQLDTPDVFYSPYTTDPRTNVIIDGKRQHPDYSLYPTGTYWWKIASGSTLEYTLNINSGALAHS